MKGLREFAAGMLLIEKGSALLEKGAIDDAEKWFREAAENGVAEGWLQLAEVEFRRGNHEAKQSYFRNAEVLAEQGDAFACFCCSLSCQLGRGGGSMDEQEQKAIHFLLKAAELGLPAAQIEFAVWHLWGLNGAPVDEKTYETWIWRAIEQEDDVAIVVHVNNLLRLKQEIEPHVMQKLQKAAVNSAYAKRTLKKVNRLCRWNRSGKSPG